MPNREVMDKVIAHTKKETKMASGMPAWMSKIAKTNSRSNRKRPAEGGEGTEDKDEQASEKSQKIEEIELVDDGKGANYQIKCYKNARESDFRKVGDDPENEKPGDWNC